jgi:hypothetical protein
MANPPVSNPPAPRKPASQPTESIVGPLSDLAELPPRVAALRDKILEAVATRDIENLRPAIEWNETPPIFARGARPMGFSQTIEFLKSRSFDGRGDEILTILSAILEQSYARVTRGPAVTYVWPAFAARQRPDPTPDERLAMYRCSRFANIVLTNDIGLPLIERVGIGADGTWHYFWAG